MSKKGKMFVVMIAIFIQVILGVGYGFSNLPISAGACFVIWCACTMMICRFLETSETF